MTGDTLLHRIIRPDWWLQSETVSSQAFRPAPSDEKFLSTYDGDQISPKAAYEHYTKDISKSPPVGVLAVTVAECSSLGLPALPDPNTFPEHVLIDFTRFGVNQIKKKAELLRDMAIARKWQFRP
jgi:hypothetical protein